MTTLTCASEPICRARSAFSSISTKMAFTPVLSITFTNCVRACAPTMSPVLTLGMMAPTTLKP